MIVHSGTLLLERYRLETELGHGGMGTVYKARDTVLKRDVAVKLLSSSGLGTEGRARLLREAQTAAQLDHPNIVTVFDVSDYQGSPFIVMQLIEGGTLNDSRPENLDETLLIFKQLCLALEHAHVQGIIHRDLKPENVMLTADGTAMLADFGLARSVVSRMSSEGTIVGTVHYMAPEQALGKELDTRADLYALGVMLYEFTTGQLPFDGDGPVAIITQHLNAPVVPPRARNEAMPNYLNNLILKLLEKDPENRPQSASEVLQILESPEEEDGSLRESKEFSVLDRIVRGRIIGRREEYEKARYLWREAASGRGQTLLISGEPGIGKTRLVREVVTQAEVSGSRALVGEAYAESNAPYGAFAQILRQGLSNGSQNGLDLPDFVLDDLLDLAPDLRPYYPDIEPNPDLDPESKQVRLFENALTFCHTLSKVAPLLLVLDDAHWADSSSIALFHHLARRTKKMPILLLAAYREVELREARSFNEMLLEFNRQRLGTRIKLGRLDKDKTQAMLAAIFDDEITPDFLEGIYRETDGNPFFIEEVCRALVESGELYFADGEWHRPAMEELEIPQGIQVAVESRLSKLPQTVQETLRLAAILGREFDYEVLIEASDLDEDEIILAIETADRVQMVQEGRDATGRAFTAFEFVHALVPQAIRENTHRLRRRKLHKQAAAAYEIVQPENYESLAYHHGEGGNDERALHYYTLAGERALGQYANQDAENHFTAALNLTDDDSKRARLLVQLGESLERQSRFKEAIMAWEQAIDLFLEHNNKDQVADLFALSARATWSDGDTQRGLDICRQGLAVLEGAPDGPGIAHLLAETARACYFNGINDEVELYANQALAMSEQFDLVGIRADSLITLASSKRASSNEAIPMFEEAISISESANLLTEGMRAYNNLGVLHAERGNFVEAIQCYHQAAVLAGQKGDLNSQLFFSANIIWSRLPLGQVHDAEKEFAELRNLLEELPDPGAGGRTLESVEAVLAWAKGEFQLTLQLSERNIQNARKTNDLFPLLLSMRPKVEILLLTGELDRVKRLVKEAIEIARGFHRGIEQYCWLSMIASRQGNIKQAEESLQNARSIVVDDQPAFQGQVNIARAEAHLLAAKRDWQAAWDKYGQLQDLLAEKQMHGIASSYALEWVDAILQGGEPDDIVRAKDLLQKASSTFNHIGAVGWVELSDKKLAQIEIVQ